MDLKNNPHYQNGVFKGSQIIESIEKTTYGTIEKAFEAKVELINKLKTDYGWDDTHKDVAETLGIIAILEVELKAIEKVVERVVKILCEDDIFDIAHSIGLSVTDEQISWILEAYPEAQDLDQNATWNLVIENLIHESNNL
jgi:hypothetical protein